MNHALASSLPRRLLAGPSRLLAAGVLAALAGSISLTALAQEARPATPPAAMHGGMHHGMHGGMHGGGFGLGGPMQGRGLDRMLDSVNATPEQRTEIKRIADAARADLKGQREQGRALHEQAAQLFTQPTVDANAAEQLRQQMMARHDQASRRMMQAMLDVSRVLTAEQRKQLGDRMAQRRQMMLRHQQERMQLDRPAR